LFSSGFFDRVLSALRDNALEGIGTIFAILVVIVPWVSRKLRSSFSNTQFQRVFWWLSVPTLSTLTIIAAIWQRLELVVTFSVAIGILYLVRQKEISGVQTELEQQRKELAETVRRDSAGESVSPYYVVKGAKRGQPIQRS